MRKKPYLDEADPVFMVDIMGYKHLRHPRHIIKEVIHVLDLHSVEEGVRLSQICGTAEPIRWR
jgi:hypothetical protein